MTKMSASEAFVETLVAQGVTHVFGIVGSAYMDALDLFEAAGIRFISVAHEQGAGHMADGFSRASGRHGVCIAQNGPGITNFVTAVAAAYWAHSPVVMITPETGSNTQGLGGFQETEQLPFFEKITKYQVHCANQARIPELLSRCFDYALLERGPTQFNIPRDLFYGEFDATIPKPIRVERGAGGPESLEEAVKLLAEAEVPGDPLRRRRGDVRRGRRGGEARRISHGARGQHLPAQRFLPQEPSALVRPDRLSGLEGGDEAPRQGRCRAGARHPARPLRHLAPARLDYWPKNAKLIQVEADPRRIGLVKQASVGVCGDAQAATSEILHRLQTGNVQVAARQQCAERLAEIEKQKKEWEAELNQWGQGGRLSRSARAAPCASSRRRCRKTPW